MSAVTFAIPGNTGLDENEALELAEVLSRQRTLAADSACAKIREQARRDVNRGETSADVDLTLDELEAVLAVLQQGNPNDDSDGVRHLRAMIARHLDGATVRTAGLTFRLTSADTDAITGELNAIGLGSLSVSDADAFAARFAARETEPIDLDDHERFLLLRATNHLRYGGVTGRAVTELRDHLSDTGDAGWIAYTLSHLDGRPDQAFTSYSLKYEPDDRLVAPDGGQLRVVSVDAGTLTVDDWERTT